MGLLALPQLLTFLVGHNHFNGSIPEPDLPPGELASSMASPSCLKPNLIYLGSCYVDGITPLMVTSRWSATKDLET